MANGLRKVGRKLLIASLGVASVSYGACSASKGPSASDGAQDSVRADAAPEHPDGSVDQLADTASGNDGAADASVDRQFVGNLV
jgi:hypothetical protein